MNLKEHNEKYIKVLLWFLVISSSIIFFSILTADILINISTKNSVVNSTKDIRYHKVGLLLGTSKYLKAGGINPYYKNRLLAAKELIDAGKIDYIIISGDNSLMEYNEPQMMKKDLIKGGIHQEQIFLDYAGFRTFDSVIRLRAIFGQESAIVISQEFHNKRAIYIASAKGIKLTGYNADDITGYNSLRVHLREKLARFFVFIDLAFDRQPKFLGDKIDIDKSQN